MMKKIALKVKPTGLLPDKEESLIKALEKAGKETMRAIHCSPSFNFKALKNRKGAKPIALKVCPTGLSPEKEKTLIEALEKAGEETARAIGCC